MAGRDKRDDKDTDRSNNPDDDVSILGEERGTGTAGGGPGGAGGAGGTSSGHRSPTSGTRGAGDRDQDASDDET